MATKRFNDRIVESPIPIQVGVTASGEIDTTSGNLTIDSAGGTVSVDDNITVSGNATISGNTTISGQTEITGNVSVGGLLKTTPTSTTISSSSATQIYSVDGTYRTAELTVQATQGSKYTSMKAFLAHDSSTTADITQYAVLEFGSPVIPMTVDATLTPTGTNWVTRTSNFTSHITSVAYGNSLWVGVGGSGNIRTSTDAITWVTQTQAIGNLGFGDITYGNNVFVATNDYGLVQTSTNGTTWVSRNTGLGNVSIPAIAYGGGKFAIATHLGFSSSTDGITWTSMISYFGSTLRNIAYGNGRFLAHGSNGTAESTDGVTWVTRQIQEIFNFAGAYGIAYGNGLWALGGQQGIIGTSTDAITWTTRTSNFGTTTIRSISYGNGLWVATGDSGQIRTSTDAITWTTRTSNFGTTTVRCSAQNNYVWVAGGSYGELRTSIPSVSVTATITDANTTSATVKVLPTLMEA